MSTVAALAVADGLLSLALNALVAAKKAQDVIGQARAENREVSDQELADIQAANQTLTAGVLAKLRAAEET